MALTRDEVLHVADLARLSLVPEEIEVVTRQLNDILAYVEKLQELDTEGVEPLAHVIPVFNVFREDAVRAGLDREAALEQRPGPGRGGLCGAPDHLKTVFSFQFSVFGEKPKAF